jgi:hypothetical protein
LRSVFAGSPFRRQIGHDRGEAVLRHVLIEHDQVVEHAHHRAERNDRRFLVDRHARRTIDMRDAQNTAGFLGVRRSRCKGAEQRRGHRQPTQMSVHRIFLPRRPRG